MGRRTANPKSHTLPSSPTHSSSSSSDFEFAVAASPRKSSAAPADELFYKGQLLPLHLSPRLSMVRTLLLSSSSSSTSSSDATASRDSNGSSSSSQDFFCDSSRPSSVADEDHDLKFLTSASASTASSSSIKKTKYFSLSRFSSVFRKPRTQDPDNLPGSGPVKRVSSTAREVIRKYLKKVKPLYEKLSNSSAAANSQKQQQFSAAKRMVSSANVTMCMKQPERLTHEDLGKEPATTSISLSFSGNLRYPRSRRSCVSSCPSSMRSSPSRSGRNATGGGGGGTSCYAAAAAGASSMEELQNAIQGAIAHCKNSLLLNNSGTGSSSSNKVNEVCHEI